MEGIGHVGRGRAGGVAEIARREAEAAGVEAAVAEASTAAYSAGGAAATQAEGSLASDEALQALRDRLTGSR